MYSRRAAVAIGNLLADAATSGRLLQSPFLPRLVSILCGGRFNLTHEEFLALVRLGEVLIE